MIIKCNKCGFVYGTETVEGDISKIIVYDHSGKEKIVKDYEKGTVILLKSGKEIAKMGIDNERINENNTKFSVRLRKGRKKGNIDNINSLNEEYSKHLRKDIRKRNLIIAGDIAKVFLERKKVKYDKTNKRIIIYTNAVNENGNLIKEYEIFLKTDKKERTELITEKKGKTKIYKCKNCGKELIKIT